MDLRTQFRQLRAGDVVQLDATLEVFGGSFMTVTEVREWGVQGYITVPGRGLAYYRATYDQITFIGKAEFIQRDLEEIQ